MVNISILSIVHKMFCFMKNEIERDPAIILPLMLITIDICLYGGLLIGWLVS